MKGIFILLTALLISITSAGITHKKHWNYVKRAESNTNHTVIFAVKPKVGAQVNGDSILKQIHTPGSFRYQRHLQASEITEIFVDTAALSLVENFLSVSNIAYKTKGDFVYATASVSVLEQLLNAKFDVFAHINSPSTVIRTNQSSIPNQIAQYIAYVFHTIDFPPVNSRLNPTSSQDTRQTRSIDADPTVLRAYYGVPNVDLSQYKSNITQGILAFSAGITLSDVSTFENQFGSAAFGNITIYDSSNFDPSACYGNTDCAESSLDMEYIMAMAPGIKTVYYNNPGDGLANAANWLANDDDAVDVFSFSITVGGNSADYQQTVCTEFQKATLRGKTIFAASGDVSAYDSDCNPNDPFPQTCPYVTVVGGTQGLEYGEQEVEWTSSGAGVSSVFPMPDWQVPFAQSYYSKTSSLPLFNRNNRIFPDVSAEASSFPFEMNGQLFTEWEGTSFASPIFAGIFTQILVHRTVAGRAPIGYLNEVLAKLVTANKSPLRDITQGYTADPYNCATFYATTGWDIGTGWGSPVFSLMTQYIGSYPDSLSNFTTPTSIPTNSPTKSPTNSPTKPSTSGGTYPTNSPTNTPTNPPVTGSCPFTLTQKMSSTWQEGGQTITQYTATLTNTGTQMQQVSLTFATAPLSSFSLSGPESDGVTFDLPNWYSGGLPGGASLGFGYNAQGMAPTAITLNSPLCGGSSPTSSPHPTVVPTTIPTSPSHAPTTIPTNTPTSHPTNAPTTLPSNPTSVPTLHPTTTPTNPTTVPTSHPTTTPTTPPTTSTCHISFSNQIISSWTDSTGPVFQVTTTIVNTGATTITHLEISTEAQASNIIQLWQLDSVDNHYVMPSYEQVSPSASISFGYVIAHSTGPANFEVINVQC